MPKGKQGFQKGIGYWTGKKRPPISEEWRNNLKGRTPWNKGMKNFMTPEGKQRMIDSKKGKPTWNKGLKMPEMTGENHFAWKGDKVGYDALHTWVVRKLGTPDTCEHCGKSGLIKHKIHWANIDHQYKRNLEDWIRLCAKCHRKHDIKNNIYKTK